MITSHQVTDADLGQFCTLYSECYPGMKTNSPEEFARLEARLRSSLDDSRFTMHGLWEGDRLVAGMRYHSYTMNCFGHSVLCGGAAVVAVRLDSKKRGLAKRLMSDYLEHYRSQGAVFAALYAFRPDFYYDMGFGYGAPTWVFSVAPKDIPRPAARPNVRLLTVKDVPTLHRSFNGYVHKHSGAFEETELYLAIGYESQPEVKYAAVFEGEEIIGYIKFKFEQANPTNFVCTDIRIIDLVCDDRTALGHLFSFLHNQHDQIRRVLFTTYDEQLYSAFRDVRDGSDNMTAIVTHQMCTGGMGIMYRVINTHALFETLRDHNFGNESLTLKIDATDTFLPANNQSLVIRFAGGYPTIVESTSADVAITLSVADFSSLILGAVKFDRLYKYGKAEISEVSRVDQITHLFASSEKPICLSRF
ncbi:MAG: GNAT family N-acetyltransferase [Candidatus Zixiibacteriota bacterium]